MTAGLRSKQAMVEHMDVAHSSSPIVTAQSFLNRVDTLTAFPQLGGKRMLKSVTVGHLNFPQPAARYDGVSGAPPVDAVADQPPGSWVVELLNL